jgi:hypothetical protein
MENQKCPSCEDAGNDGILHQVVCEECQGKGCEGCDQTGYRFQCDTCYDMA